MRLDSHCKTWFEFDLFQQLCPVASAKFLEQTKGTELNSWFFINNLNALVAFNTNVPDGFWLINDNGLYSFHEYAETGVDPSA